MCDLKVCRICLRKDAKVYRYDRFHLKQYYEEVLGKKVFESDSLPKYFCYECAAILYKFHKFKEKCWTGQKALMELVWSSSITLSSLSQIDRQDKNLQSSIDIINKSVTKRVRTYLIKNKTLSINVLEQSKKVDVPEIKDQLDYESDTSLNNRNVAEIKNEMINEKTDCILQDENMDMDIQTGLGETTPPALEGERTFTDGEDLNSESLHNTEKPAITEEPINVFNIEESKIKDTEKANTDNEIEHNKNHEENKREKPEAKKKRKRFENVGTSKEFLDPNHWLKINLSEEEALEEFRARAHDRKYVSAAYKCTDCYKSFSKEYMITRHNKIRHGESMGRLVCRFCNMRFKIKYALNQHISQHYTKYKCLRCDLVCPLKTTALFHNDYHNGVIRKCRHCEKDFRHLSTYYTHLRTHHRSEYVCAQCGASFVSTKGLNLHFKRTMHTNTEVNPDEEVTNTYCVRCDIKFKTRKAYEKHYLHSAKHPEGVENLEHETPVPKQRKNMGNNSGKITPCNICNRNFPSVTAYMKHHRAEHKYKPHNYSKEETRHICEICGASLAANSMATHLNTHTREKLYTCSTCSMQFNSKSSMNRHQLTHTGEKPYECSMCDKRFTQNCSMKLHYRTFHLKEPYPKRNRRKNAGIQKEVL